MSEDKMCSDEVPQKFVEWLLSMGCPLEKVPSVDKIAEMCRGQYYMVWRSLMEHVEPKDSIRLKKLQVFCDDVHLCQKTNIFNKVDSTVMMPEELSLWKQQTELRDELAAAESRVYEARKSLNQLMGKVSSKLSHRNLTRRRVKDGQRRVWLLQRVADELRTKKANLLETRAIADSLCAVEDAADAENKLDKCLSGPRRQLRATTSTIPNNLASTSTASSYSESNEYDDNLAALVKCNGFALWPLLNERRSALTAVLPRNEEQKIAPSDRHTPQAVVAHTAALHCSLALEALKNRAHIEHTQARLAAAVSDLNKYLTGEACELLVLRCERSRTEARIHLLRSTLEELTGRLGAFALASGAAGDRHAVVKQIATVDKSIESKRDELKRLVTSLAITERKIQNVRECLISVFNGFHGDGGLNDSDKFSGQMSLPQESVSTLRSYYEENRAKRKNRMELSLNMDLSDNCSFVDPTANGTQTFVDELKMYLKNFSLEKNRKLVLDSGDKIWVQDTLQTSIERLHSKWLDDDVTCSLVCPSVSLSLNIRRLMLDVETRDYRRQLVKELSCYPKRNIAVDIYSIVEQEQKTMDKVKKRLNENLLSLQKTIKSLQLGQENLQLWSDNGMKKYISPNRRVDGKMYKEYEAYYIDNLSF